MDSYRPNHLFQISRWMSTEQGFSHLATLLFIHSRSCLQMDECCLEELEFRYTALISPGNDRQFQNCWSYYRHCVTFHMRLASTRPALLEQWHSWMHIHQYRGHYLLALLFSFFLSLTSNCFCFHGESPCRLTICLKLFSL